MFKPKEGDYLIIENREYKIDIVDANIDTDLLDIPQVVLENDIGYFVFESKEEAGEVAKNYFEYMVENDPYSLIDYVGVEQVIEWAKGGGETLIDWLEAWLDVPEELYGSDEIIAQYRSVDSKVQDVVLYATCSS